MLKKTETEIMQDIKEMEEELIEVAMLGTDRGAVLQGAIEYAESLID